MGLIAKRAGAGSYDVLDGVTKAKVGEIHKTGTHLDNYPWDWHFSESGLRGKVRTSGVSDTLRAAKETMAFQWGLIPPVNREDVAHDAEAIAYAIAYAKGTGDADTVRELGPIPRFMARANFAMTGDVVTVRDATRRGMHRGYDDAIGGRA